MRWLAFLVTLSLQAAPPEWRAGAARVKITPEEPLPMAGYAGRTEPFQGVDTDLYGRALALEDSAGNRALLITAEILGFPSKLAENVCRRVSEVTRLERSSILLNGSHTHTGPVVAPEMGWPPPGPSAQRVTEYVARLEDKLVAVALESLKTMAPVRLSWGMGVAPFAMNRREDTERGIILGVNPRGPVDRSVPVLRIENAHGSLRAVAFGAAVHPVTLGGKHLRINGDYVGYALSDIEEAQPGVTALFVSGCGADANPYPKGSIEDAKAHGRNLAAEVRRVMSGGLKPLRGPLRTQLRRVDLPLRRFSREQVEQLGKAAPSWQKYFVERALDILNRGGELPASYSAPFALWQFGTGLTLVAFSGETVVDYVALSAKRLGPLNLWVAGYSNDLFGYLPSARLLAEGGYETRGLYMGVGLFEPSVEEVVMKAVVEMARAAGRP